MGRHPCRRGAGNLGVLKSLAARGGFPMLATHRPETTSVAALFARVGETANGAVTPALRRHIVRLRFSAEDEARMHELAAKNQEGRLSEAEKEVLDNYVKVGDLLAILQSKARKVLKRVGRGAGDHG